MSRAEKALVVLFILTLPTVQPRVTADGIGYYAFARSLLIDHNLQFKSDWKDLRLLPKMIRRDANGKVLSATNYTRTGHLDNFYAVGPAVLWTPFLVVTHLSVRVFDRFGFHIPADGFSLPYRATMAVATAIYGFLGLWFSFQFTRRYIEERWAFVATLGVWFGSSLPVYMYVEPAWSHAHSAFAVAFFLWYWDRTRGTRTGRQWAILGLLAGLMADVYFVNALFVLALALEEYTAYRSALSQKPRGHPLVSSILRGHLLFAACALLAFLPTLICREIIFGNPLALGAYASEPWGFRPWVIWAVAFSPSHGLVIFTPILGLAIAGLFILRKGTPEVGNPLLLAALSFYGLISIDPWWNGIYSFGNRFFVSLTPLFVVGLASALRAFAKAWRDGRAAARRIAVILSLLLLWNVGLVLQFSLGLLPASGETHWDEVLYNQFRVLPGDLVRAAQSRFVGHSSTTLPSAAGNPQHL